MATTTVPPGSGWVSASVSARAASGVSAYRVSASRRSACDPVREWGGRRVALLHVEWRTPVPFVGLRAGPARTPGSLTLAPYTAFGWTGKPLPITPWRATAGTRVTVGVGAEWLGLFRLEAGYGVQSRQMYVAFDITRDFWDIL